MIKIECENSKSALNISVSGSPHEIGVEFYNIFEALLGTKELERHFKSALFAYLEANAKLLNDFMDFHNMNRTKAINDIVNKIFGDDEE